MRSSVGHWCLLDVLIHGVNEATTLVPVRSWVWGTLGIIVVGCLDEGRLLVCKLDLVSERLLEHVKVLDVGSLNCTTALERNLGLLQQATALVPLRSRVWGTLGIIVVGGLDESHLLVCKLDLDSERLLEHVKVLDVVSLSCTNGLELSLGLLKQVIHGINEATALVPVRSWVWGILRIIVVEDLDEGHLFADQ